MFRSVLQVIPDTMFGLLEQIMEVEGSMAELPTRLDKEHISQPTSCYQIVTLSMDAKRQSNYDI